MNHCECAIEPSIGCISNHTALATRLYVAKLLKINEIELTIEQLRVMIVLWKESEIVQKDITEIIGKDKTSITRLVNGLEKSGLVKRIDFAEDKRHNRIVITDEGKKLEEPAMKVLKQVTRTLHSNFTQKEIDITTKVLKKLCVVLNNSGF